jgi:hypothetical protein
MLKKQLTYLKNSQCLSKTVNFFKEILLTLQQNKTLKKQLTNMLKTVKNDVGKKIKKQNQKQNQKQKSKIFRKKGILTRSYLWATKIKMANVPFGPSAKATVQW